MNPDPAEVWPEHTGEGPDVSNLGNEAETTGPTAADLRRLEGVSDGDL